LLCLLPETNLKLLAIFNSLHFFELIREEGLLSLASLL
jgi:hypothetical protein